MAPYCFLVGAPILFSLFYNLKSDSPINQQSNKKKNYNILIFFSCLFLLLSLRSMDVGTDLSGYKTYFNYFGAMSTEKVFGNYGYEMELGYKILNKITYVLGNKEFQFHLTVVAGICCASVATLYYKESENGVITILLFLTATSVFDMMFSGLRQVVAIALAAPTFYLVKNKKILWFLLCVFLATLFHKSAFIMLLLYPAYHIKLKPLHAATLLAPAAVLIYLFRNQLFELLLPLAGEEYVDKYGEVQNTGAITMIILIAMFVIFSFVVPDEGKMDDETIGLRNILSLSLILQIFATTNFVAMRFNYYFLLFLPLTIPRIINRWQGDDKNSKLITNIVLILFFAAYYFYRAFSDVDPLEIYPYSFFWQ